MKPGTSFSRGIFGMFLMTVCITVTGNASDNQPGFQTWQDETGSWYAIFGVDGSLEAPRLADYRIYLRSGVFDPLKDPVPTPRDPWLESSAESRLFLVQFHTRTLETYLERLQALGAVVVKYLPQHTHIILMTPQIRQAIETLPFVRWIGPYHPSYRLESYLTDNLHQAAMAFPLLRYNIMVLSESHKAVVADRIAHLGGMVYRANAGKHLLEADLTPRELLTVAAWDEVLYIDRWGEGERDMDLAREISGANYVETVEGYVGTGVRAEILDVGFNMTHIAFDHHPLITHTPVGVSPHGAACSGIIFGDGSGNPAGRGVMPDGQGIVADWDEVSIGQPRYEHTGELLEEPYQAVFQSSSVGSPRTDLYTTISADTDQALFDFDILHCQSLGDSGNTQSRPQAWAKNIISGGGLLHQNSLTRDDDCWCGASSIGPAEDGRIKPDLVHFYDNITTVSADSDTSYTNSFGGSSGATPIICGHAGLVYQMWSDGLFGNPFTPGGTVFQNRPHMTTMKALLINSAYRYPFTGTGHDLNRRHQGWGMPDIKNLHDYRNNIFIVNEDNVLADSEVAIYELMVKPDEPILRVTMTYADPPGMPGATMHRINDLTLQVISPSLMGYWGNNGLLEGNASIPGGTADQIDTVENVFVTDPQPGTWIVRVIAQEINEDGHVETPQMDADFALVVTGATGKTTIACPGDLNGDGVVDFSDIQFMIPSWNSTNSLMDTDADGWVTVLDFQRLFLWFGTCP